MNIKKMSGSLVAATLMLGLNTIAMADCGAVIQETEDLATALRCIKDDGYWANNPDSSTNAIWQWKGKGSMGCAVHLKLARQLNEEREEYNPDTMPPYKGAKTKNGNNTAAGAANDLRNGKLKSALAHYQTFMDTIRDSAKLNGDFVPTADFPLPYDGALPVDAARDAAAFFSDQVYTLQQDAAILCAT